MISVDNLGPPLESSDLIVHHAEDVMGTIVTIDVYGPSTVNLELVTPYLSSALASLHNDDSVFSLWKADSPMSKYRRGELDLASAPDVIGEVLEACQAARELSRGWFDPWALPGGTDPTGYVKGWAAQRALHQLLGAPVHGAIVNAAGDIASFGYPAENEKFQVGITNPLAPNEMTAIAALDGCVATSGNYERGQHLLDPYSGDFCTRVASASVMGPDLGLA
ncbi:MAG TPA: FAD:protein FMN transferase, partial [Acidimicrobiales bacterium]|nr:FAD:protein FMN transferase [Acidimicrobiales bacterium]